MTQRIPVQRLVEGARQGDRGAFDELVKGFGSRLRASVDRWTRFRLGSRIDLDDVIQETFLRAYGSLDRFQFSEEDEAESFFRWLCGIAKRALGDLIRRAANREKPVSSVGGEARGPSQSQVLRRGERLDRLQSTLDKLPSDYRQVLTLSRLEGLSAQEIADRMGRTPNAVYHLIVRALKLLREEFGDTESLHLPDRPLRREGVDDGQ